MSIRVLAAVIKQAGRVLICRRPTGKRHGDLWEFPGGKIEPHETNFEAASRELDEELAVSVTAVGTVAFSIRDPGSDYTIEFIPVKVKGTPRCLEHSELAWALDDELLNFGLAPSDQKYAEYRLGTSRFKVED